MEKNLITLVMHRFKGLGKHKIIIYWNVDERTMSLVSWKSLRNSGFPIRDICSNCEDQNTANAKYIFLSILKNKEISWKKA